MKRSISSPMMTVTLREATVALLMAQRANEQETLDSVVARLAGAPAPIMSPPPIVARPAPRAVVEQLRPDRGNKYGVIVLDVTITAPTLSKMLGKVVDVLAAVDAAAIERLATMSARKRAFVARTRDAVHPGRPDLPTHRATSGWWVSANIGTADIERALRALSDASGLSYGYDIVFLGKLDQNRPKS